MQAHQKEAHWQTHLQQWRTSGKTQKAYCDEAGLKQHQFVYWKQKLADTDSGADNVKQSSAFIPVQIQQHRDDLEPVSLVLPSGLVIRGITGDTLPWLKQLVSALV